MLTWPAMRSPLCSSATPPASVTADEAANQTAVRFVGGAAGDALAALLEPAAAGGRRGGRAGEPERRPLRRGRAGALLRLRVLHRLLLTVRRDTLLVPRQAALRTLEQDEPAEPDRDDEQ